MKISTEMPTEKECSKCRDTKDVSCFNKSGRNYGSPFRSYCKECQSAYHKSDTYKKAAKKYHSSEKGKESRKKAKARHCKTEKYRETLHNYYAENRDKMNAKALAWYRENRERLCEYQRKRRALNREKSAARLKAWRKARDVQPCVRCQNPKGERHHPDYTKPLYIIWLCRSCHGKLHGAEKRGVLFAFL